MIQLLLSGSFGDIVNSEAKADDPTAPSSRVISVPHRIVATSLHHLGDDADDTRKVFSLLGIFAEEELISVLIVGVLWQASEVPGARMPLRQINLKSRQMVSELLKTNLLMVQHTQYQTNNQTRYYCL